MEQDYGTHHILQIGNICVYKDISNQCSGFVSKVKPEHSLLTFLTYPVHREQYVSPVTLNGTYCEGVK